MNICIDRRYVATLVAALALVSTAAQGGVMISSPVLGGGVSTKYVVDGGDPTLLVVDNGADLATVLTGDSSDPGGNVELGKLGSTPVTTLSGTLAGKSIVLSSLVLGDWFDGIGPTALTLAYIGDAAASAGIVLTPAELALIAQAFVLGGNWERVSDPNIGYVNYENGRATIGLQGLLNATSFLETLLPGNPTLDDGLQVSEVVKVDFLGRTEYLYGFSATSTGRSTQDGPTFAESSYSGNYQVSVPLPGTLALLALGLFGVARKRSTMAARDGASVAA